MKKFINQFSASLKNNILVFLTFPFVDIVCTRQFTIASENSNISPNAAVRAAVTATTTKANIKLFSFTEVNDTNPLNNLNFTLKNSGKPLIDMVVLFSANINYDAANDKVFVSNNPNVQHLLTNRAKYLKPLQDKGIKVILSILGNHDRSGIAIFQQHGKSICSGT